MHHFVPRHPLDWTMPRGSDNTEVRGVACASYQVPLSHAYMLTDLAQTRRERNRQAQHNFRLRRQAAEAAQQRRIAQLEDTVERLSNVLVGLCDEMLNSEEVARHPRLMTRLHRSTTDALALAKSISGSVDSVDDYGVNTPVDETPRPHETQPRMTVNDLSSKPRPAKHSWFSSGPVFGLWPTAGESTHEINEVGEVPAKDVQSSTGPVPLPPWPKTIQDTTYFDLFPIRLVKVSLALGCSCLSGELGLPESEIQRAFGPALRVQSRQQVLSHLQWLLGPGQNHLHETSGADWSPGSSETSSSDSSPPSQSTNSSSDSGDTYQAEFLTAVGVHEQLQSFGATLLDQDTMELRFTGSERPGTLPEAPSPILTAPSLQLMAATRLILRLNISVLANNLAYMGICLGKGPVYPRQGIASAVEASIVRAWEV